MVYWDEQGNTVEISKADQLWLDDGYFKTQQAHLPPDAPRAALSYRVSTKGQVDHNDIPMQKIKCRKFAQQQGWRVVMEKAEKGISGSKVSASKRDVIQELRQEAGNGSFDILLVYMFDRLGRIESETPFVLEWFVQHGIQMLARLIAEAETEVRQAKEEYAELLRNDTTRATIQQIRSYYDEFLGWANEFDLATIPRKRAILGQLIEKVEVGKGYKVTVHLRMSYAQFLGIEGNGEIQVRKDVCA